MLAWCSLTFSCGKILGISGKCAFVAKRDLLSSWLLCAWLCTLIAPSLFPPALLLGISLSDND